MAFGENLRQWRQARRLSQLDLGLAANVSARHISFLETGRARPSRMMVMQICAQLDLPREARNRMLTAAGFAPLYRRRAMTEAEMAPARAALDWMLARHDPYPAMLLDRHWVLRGMNVAAGRLLAGAGIVEGTSLLEAMTDEGGLLGAVENRTEVLTHIVARLRVESAHFGGDPVLDAAAARFADILPPGPRIEGPLAPLVPTVYRLGGLRLSLLSVLAQFGTADDIALAELRTELMFPADAATRDVLLGLAEGA